MESVAQFVIPDFYAKCPWTRKLSKHFLEIKAESDAWVESFCPFNDEGLEGLRRINCALLGCHLYATLDKELIRLGCDLMALFYVLEEYTDVANHDETSKICEIVMDALRDPRKARPDGEHVVGVISKDFSTRLSKYPPPGDKCLERFICDIDDYLSAVVEEARIRSRGQHSSFQDFFKIRLYTVGCKPTCGICEFGLDLPVEVLSHPKIQAIRENAPYLMAITNDIYSFAMERSRGGGLASHNSVELIMAEKNLDVQAAIEWLERGVSKVVDTFLDDINSLPSWGNKVDQKVKIYVDGVAQVLRGADDWSYESRRYFGNKGLEVQKSRVMTTTLLSPKDWQGNVMG
ncbi:hypothetical protein GALMADRAFT_137032 [Galerina marginata CBS 339.88]|uniref:Terpene synthase n=1 Tax=Galerina marginata (strain CBS 339.88) TaxID=685588 RepID=A0A067T7H0_GALM3|nr:hypothetical protein GALMADRAFT_137032 [Galerina marginata CBS 339.88]